MLGLEKYWRWLALIAIVLVSRLVLLRVYDIELSQDGFDAVSTVIALQTQGAGALSPAQITRFVLHPFYSLALFALRLLTPASFDFYGVARFFSALAACAAVILAFEFTRRAFNETAAWLAALFLAGAPTFLWESIAILSSPLFLAFYLGVLLALLESRYRLAALLAFGAAVTRVEGVMLIALVLIALFYRDARARAFARADWLAAFACALATPAAMLTAGAVTSGNPLAFIGVQSVAALWLAALAPGDFFSRARFFLTQYPALIPALMVWLGVAGALIALWKQRTRGVGLLFLTSALYLIFFETLVWFNYTTLEVRFLMYPGLPLILLAASALAFARQIVEKISRPFANFALGIAVLVLLAQSFQQGIAGIQFIYNSYSSQREVADELARLIPKNQPTNVMIYGGIAGALDYYARPRGIELAFTYFRFAPDDYPEQFLLDRKIKFLVYPVGNAFAKAKFPDLARFETHTRRGVTFQPLTKFATTPDQQLYSIWLVRVAD